MNKQPCMQPKEPFPQDTALAIAYVKWQTLGDAYEPEMGLCNGTIFPCLHKPFYGRRGRCGQ